MVLLGDPDILSAGGPSEVKCIFRSRNNMEQARNAPQPARPGIKSMASLHAYATVQNATRPHEFSTEFSGPLDDVADLYGDGVLPKDGNMILSDRPGLGIELKETAVTKLTL